MPLLPTFDQLYAVSRGAILSRSPQLNNFDAGTSLDAIAGAAASLADVALGFIVDAFSEHFVHAATGSALDALALDRYGLQREQAVASVGTLLFTRGSGSVAIPIALATVATYTAPDGTVYEYETTAAATIPSGGNTVAVASVARVTGVGANAPSGAVTSLQAPPPEDPQLSVTNTERFAGGRLAASDEEFRRSIAAYNLTLRKGTVDAIEQGARTVPGVQFATVDESTVPSAGGGYVSVYVGDPDGAGNTALADAVTVELTNWRCAGVNVRTFASAREEITLAITIKYRANANKALLDADIRASVLSYVNGLSAGAVLYTSRIESLAHSVDRFNVVEAVASPSTNAPAQAYNALRLLDADISLTFVEV